MRALSTILVATDLTTASDDVVRAAAALAALADAKLHVLHAFDFQSLPYLDEPPVHAGFQGRIQGAERALDEQIRRTVRTGVAVASREVMIYVAHKAILWRAEAVGADLIVLGPHRRRARGDAFLGTTANGVIRASEVPCLIVRGPLSLPLRRVLNPLDLSEPAVAALDVALEWSEALRPGEDDTRGGPELVVLHVVPHGLKLDDLEPDPATIRAELDREVETAPARVAERSSVNVRTDVRWGDSAAGEIVRTIDQQDIDLVVMGTHGYGALGRMLLGSVASHVARSATCPVLLVPPTLRGARLQGRPGAHEEAGQESPLIRELDRPEIEAILARNHVGRIGYARNNRVEIQPVHYVYSDGWIYGRTSHGAKYRTLAETAYRWWPVVFEVDEVEGPFRWRSVLVRGGFYALDSNGSAEDREIWAKALEVLRTAMPATLREDDPVPFRTVLFRIAAQDATGREATPTGGAPAPDAP